MRLLVFVVFVALASIAMAVSSYLAGVSVAGIALRVFAVLVILQVVYFLLLVVMSLFAQRTDDTSEDTIGAEATGEHRKQGTNPTAR